MLFLASAICAYKIYAKKAKLQKMSVFLYFLQKDFTEKKREKHTGKRKKKQWKRN